MPLRKNNLICARLSKVQVRNGRMGMEGKNAGNLFVLEKKTEWIRRLALRQRADLL